jgi:hypothetical protein
MCFFDIRKPSSVTRGSRFVSLAAADMLRDELEDLLEREVVAAEHVALTRHTALRSREVARGDVVDVHEVQPRIDEGRHTARGRIEQDAARRRRLDVARADRRRRVHRHDGKLELRCALADGLFR